MYGKALGSFPVGDSDGFFVPHSGHREKYVFVTTFYLVLVISDPSSSQSQTQPDQDEEGWEVVRRSKRR